MSERIEQVNPNLSPGGIDNKRRFGVSGARHMEGMSMSVVGAGLDHLGDISDAFPIRR